MNATVSKSSSDAITPAVHLEFIQNQLENVTASTPEQIEQYHRALFLHAHAPEWERHRQQIKTCEAQLSFLESRLQDTHRRLSERPRLVAVDVDGAEDIKPTAPWNAWDAGMFIVGCLAVLGLMTFGVLNVSFNLLESGLVTFRENPLRTYFWAALLPVGALAVKIGWDLLDDPDRKRRYTWSCLILGMIGVLVWAGAYACVYPTLSKGIDEQIAALTVFDSAAGTASPSSALNFAGAKWIDAATVAGQAVAEIFLSAVIGIYLTLLYSRHRPVRLASDPTFAQLDLDRRELEKAIGEQRMALAEASGGLIRLENQLSALIAYGCSIFHREAARRQDQSEKKQIILEQLSDHLRHHLTGLEAPDRWPRATSGPGNGT